MSVRLKLLVIVLFVGLVPLSVSALTALRMHRAAFDAKVEQQHRDMARSGARLTDDFVRSATRALAAVAQPIPWQALEGEELAGALSLIYQQRQDIAAVQLLNQHGRPVGPAVFVGDVDAPATGHPSASAATLAQLGRRTPPQRADNETVRLGEVFWPEDSSQPLLPVAIRVGADAPWTLSVGWALGDLCERIAKERAGRLDLVLAAPSGRALCPSALGMLPKAVRSRMNARSGALFEFPGSSGSVSLAALSPTELGWTVLVQQSADLAYATSRRMRQQTLLWIGIALVIALAAGLVLARGISTRIDALRAGVRQLALGNLDYRIERLDRDEFGELGGTFNAMSDEIQARDAEIRGWNEELRARVEKGTRELREAQQQLLQSQKMAAMSSLAAGVAHEINNPLTAVLGMTQILAKRFTGRDDEKTVTLLRHIEGESKRIRDIVRSLQALSEESEGAAATKVEVATVLDAAMAVVSESAKNRGVDLSWDGPTALPVVRGSEVKLREALVHVLNNAVSATSAGDQINVDTKEIESGALRISVSDTGTGIASEHLDRIFEPFFTTKQQWEGRGLGLTVAYRLVEEHGGTIRVRSEEGRGTTVDIVLPTATQGAHLV